MPVFFGYGFGSAAGDDARVVEQDVDAPELGQGPLDNAGAGLGVGVVRLEEPADASRRPDLGSDSLAAVPPASRYNNLCPFLRKEECGSLADAGGGAGDDSDAAREFSHKTSFLLQRTKTESNIS